MTEVNIHDGINTICEDMVSRPPLPVKLKSYIYLLKHSRRKNPGHYLGNQFNSEYYI